MKCAICFFSGTGNSYHIALQIHSRFPETSLFFIPKTDPEALLDFDEIGFVFPTYFFGIPDVVRKFVNKLHFTRPVRIFAIITCGGGPGIVMDQFKSLMKTKKKILAYSKILMMPDDYILLYRQDKEKNELYLKQTESTMETVLTDLANGSTNRFRPSFFRFLSGIQILIGRCMKYTSRFFRVKGCIGCKRCVETCPTQNIRYEDGTIHYGKQCVGCLGCINTCPMEAIQFLKATKNKGRYIHPKSDPISINKTLGLRGIITPTKAKEQ